LKNVVPAASMLNQQPPPLSRWQVVSCDGVEKTGVETSG
jgi:hypothetical protein